MSEKITKQELINDLISQIENHKNKNVPDSELTLNIGTFGNLKTIDFEFNFEDILKKLGITEKNVNSKLICPYPVAFMSITFNQQVVCYHTIFSQGLIFRDTTFSQNLKFYFIAFSQDLKFLDTTFEQKAMFFGIKSEQNIKFDNIVMTTDKSYLIFQNIYDTSYDSTIEIINTVINGRIDFNHVSIAKIDLKGSNVTGVLNIISIEVKSKNSQTACILKNEELKRNNFVESLKFQAEEKKLLETELWDNLSWLGWKKFFSWLERLGDWFSLYLGKIFHNHGQNWVLAFFWTMFILVLSFTCFYLPNPITDWSVWAYKFSGGIYFSELFQYLVPTDYKQIQGYFI